MDATFLQKGDNPRLQHRLGGQQWPRMVTSRQVREALRRLRTEARLEPEEFADEAGVNRATVYRIEDFSKNYAPKIETVSALAESRDLSLAEFFASIEGILIKADGLEISVDDRSFLALDVEVRRIAIAFARSLEVNLPGAREVAPTSAHPPGTRTKSAKGRHR